jgi:hypothetical protein
VQPECCLKFSIVRARLSFESLRLIAFLFEWYWKLFASMLQCSIGTWHDLSSC